MIQEKKKILIVCRGFYPESSPRAYRATELAKEFARQGHKVTVLTPKHSGVHDIFEKGHHLTIKNLGSPKWKSPDFGKSKIGHFLTRALSRFLSLGLEYPDLELMFLTKRALKHEEGFDILISIAVPYPIHWGVARVWNTKQRISKIWVADCGDPYMGGKTDSFRKWFYFEYVEKWFMRKTDFITIPIENGKRGYFREFHSKIRIIPQGFKIDVVPEINKYQTNSIPTFAYAGGFIPNIRDPLPFLDYLSTLGNNFMFIIYTNSYTLIDSYQEKLAGKFEIREYIPRHELLSVLSSMDFLVNFDNNTSVQMPSKLIDYAIVKRPVLNITKNLDKETIDEFLSGNYNNKMTIPDMENYKIENVCTSFIKLLNINNA